MKVALISLDQEWEDKAHNRRRCAELAAHAQCLGAELVIFPEMSLTGFTMNTALVAEPPDASPTVKSFSDLARELSIWLVAGVVLRATDKATNTLVAFSPDGEERARYIKIHPFSFVGEDQFFQSGCALAKMQLPDFNLGFSICYDLRFPELFSALANDCDVLVNIANWPKRRIQHWRVLLQARAIENQVYVIGVNRIGFDANNLEYERSSLVADANGEILAPIAIEGEIDVYDLNRQALDDFKRSFSTRQDRLPELYRSIIVPRTCK